MVSTAPSAFRFKPPQTVPTAAPICMSDMSDFVSVERIDVPDDLSAELHWQFTQPGPPRSAALARERYFRNKAALYGDLEQEARGLVAAGSLASHAGEAFITKLWRRYELVSQAGRLIPVPVAASILKVSERQVRSYLSGGWLIPGRKPATILLAEDDIRKTGQDIEADLEASRSPQPEIYMPDGCRRLSGDHAAEYGGLTKKALDRFVAEGLDPGSYGQGHVRDQSPVKGYGDALSVRELSHLLAVRTKPLRKFLSESSQDLSSFPIPPQDFGLGDVLEYRRRFGQRLRVFPGGSRL